MKYTVGLLAGQLSGKAGNTVASRNRNGSYFRTRVNPMLVRNSFTTGVRDQFTALSQAFRSLTSDQVRGWNSLGGQMIRSNSIGQSSGMTGLQAYVSLNQRRMAYYEILGADPLTDAPAFGSVPDAGSPGVGLNYDVAGPTTTVTAGATSATQTVGDTTGVLVGDLFTDVDTSDTATVLEVVSGTVVLLDTVLTTVTANDVEFTHPFTLDTQLTIDPIPTDLTAVFFLTAPLSGGVSRPPKSAFRYVAQFPATSTGVQSLTEAYRAKFGAPSPGQRIFYRAQYVDVNGFAGTPFESMAAEA